VQSAIERAKRIIDKKQELFIVLEELDRTGKFRKSKYKTRATFTIDEDTFNRFRNHCKKKGVKMSNRVEELIKKEINT